MDIKEFDKLAKLNKPIPANLTFYEQNYYIASRYLYRQFDAKAITVEQGRMEKETIRKQYEENKEIYEYMVQLYDVKDSLQKLKEQGFNSVLEWDILEQIEKILHK